MQNAHSFSIGLDVDGSGYLDKEDLKLICKDMYSEEQLEDIVNEADISKDGKIEFEEFITVEIMTSMYITYYYIQDLSNLLHF